MNPSAIRFSDDRSDGATRVRQHIVARAGVWVSANADRVTVVIRQNGFHGFDRERTRLLADQTADPVKSRKRVRQTRRVILPTRVWSAQEMVRMREEAFSVRGDL